MKDHRAEVPFSFTGTMKMGLVIAVAAGLLGITPADARHTHHVYRSDSGTDHGPNACITLGAQSSFVHGTFQTYEVPGNPHDWTPWAQAGEIPSDVMTGWGLFVRWHLQIVDANGVSSQ